MEEPDTRILLLGLGNDILSDDAIGPKIIQDLETQNRYTRVDYQTAAIGGLELIELFSNYQQVFIIDAIKTRNGVPGSVYYFKPEDFRHTLHLTNFHDVNFLVALELAEELGHQMPEQIHILAIEIVEDLVFSDELTPPLQAKYSEIISEICTFLDDEVILHQANANEGHDGMEK